MLEPGDLTAIAERAASAQVGMITQALVRVAARTSPELPLWSEGNPARPDPQPLPATAATHVWVAGSGAWLAEAAARRCGLQATRLADGLGEAARVLPALGVASLLADAAGPSPEAGGPPVRAAERALRAGESASAGSPAGGADGPSERARSAAPGVGPQTIGSPVEHRGAGVPW
jgi:hypothetical protein